MLHSAPLVPVAGSTCRCCFRCQPPVLHACAVPGRLAPRPPMMPLPFPSVVCLALPSSRRRADEREAAQAEFARHVNRLHRLPPALFCALYARCTTLAAELQHGVNTAEEDAADPNEDEENQHAAVNAPRRWRVLESAADACVQDFAAGMQLCMDNAKRDGMVVIPSLAGRLPQCVAGVVTSESLVAERRYRCWQCQCRQCWCRRRLRRNASGCRRSATLSRALDR